MKKLLKLVPIILILFILVIPVSASTNTTIEFTQPANTVISNLSAEFTGKITTPQKPVNPSYFYVVYQENNNNVLDGSTEVTVNNNWTYNKNTRLYENDFSFTTRLSNYVGPARVHLTMSQNNSILSESHVIVYAQPVLLTFKEKDNLAIAGNTHTFTVYAESEVLTYPTYSFEVLDTANKRINSATLSRQSNWSWDSNSGTYKQTLQFTADFGSYTGPAKVVVQASDNRTYSIGLSVRVGEEHIARLQRTEFKNHGQLVSYLTHHLRLRGYGAHKNHGQALIQCLKDVESLNLRTHAQVDRYLNSHFGLPSSTGREKK